MMAVGVCGGHLECFVWWSGDGDVTQISGFVKSNLLGHRISPEKWGTFLRLRSR